MLVLLLVAVIAVLLVVVAVLLATTRREEVSLGSLSQPPLPSIRPSTVDQGVHVQSVNLRPGDDLSALPPDVRATVEGLIAASADGDVTDDELEQIAPGAEVSRFGDVTVVRSVGARMTKVEVRSPDGTVAQYDSVDDIPDASVRDQLRRMLRERG